VRIVLDARHIRDFGIGTYIRNLVHTLAHIERDDEFHLVCSTTNETDFAGLPANFHVVPYPHSDLALKDNAAFPVFLKQFRADVYHLPLNRVPYWMVRPYVVTIHDMSRHLYSTDSRLHRQVSLWKSRHGLLRAARILTVSTATRRDVEEVFRIPPSTLRTIPNALDPRFLALAGDAAGRQERRRTLDRYQVNYPFVLYAGNIKPQKNIPRLIEAFAVLRGELAGHPEYGDLRLIIIGDDIVQHPSVRRTVHQMRIGGSVRFLGFVPQDMLQGFYESASLFAFPSLYEGFGLPPLEAMACGTPVLTSNVSSLPEVVGEAALTVNPENVFEIARGMKEILLDAELRARLIQRGKERIHHFSWDQTAREVLATYREVASLFSKRHS